MTSRIPFHRAAPQTSRCQPMLIFSQAHYLALVLVESSKVLIAFPASPSVRGRIAICYGVSTSPLSLESLANIVTVHLIPYSRSLEDTKQCWVQCWVQLGPGRPHFCDRLAIFKGALYHHILGTTRQPVPHPPH